MKQFFSIFFLLNTMSYGMDFRAAVREDREEQAADACCEALRADSGSGGATHDEPNTQLMRSLFANRQLLGQLLRQVAANHEGHAPASHDTLREVRALAGKQAEQVSQLGQRIQELQQQIKIRPCESMCSCITRCVGYLALATVVNCLINTILSLSVSS